MTQEKAETSATAVRRLLIAPIRFAYGIYAVALFLALASCALLATLFLPRGQGLVKFHSGAFIRAAGVGCPVVPATVRGTRVTLSPNGGLPRRGRIVVEFLPPVTVAADQSDAVAMELRDRAREAILRELGEPDLVEPTPQTSAAA